jgi:hypothetical protein
LNMNFVLLSRRLEDNNLKAMSWWTISQIDEVVRFLCHDVHLDLSTLLKAHNPNLWLAIWSFGFELCKHLCLCVWISLGSWLLNFMILLPAGCPTPPATCSSSSVVH